MNVYFAIVHKDSGSAYGIAFPDLPGCFSAADDAESLVPSATEALDLWFESEPVVAPRSAEEIRKIAAKELAQGAFLVAVPHVRRTTKQVRVNVSLDAGTLDAIDTAASQLKLTRSAFLAMAATNEIRGVNR